MNEPLVGRVALVTGGSRGIGAAIASSLARAGAIVAVGARDRAIGQEVAHRIRAQGGKAEAFPLDVTDPSSIELGVEAVARRIGHVDILVNNAGVAHSAPFLETSLEALRHVMDVNLVGAFATTRAVLPAMIERRWGRVIQIASTAGLTGYRYTSAYCASKHAVVGLTRSLALEVARRGITVNAVCPGWTETDMLEESAHNVAEATGRSREEAVALLANMNPMGRLLKPEEVARAVVFLACPEASGITGQTFNVDGGEVLS